MFFGCVARNIILLNHPVVSWTVQCTCSMWVNVGAYAKINSILSLQTNSATQYCNTTQTHEVSKNLAFPSGSVILNHKMEPEDSKWGKKHSPRSLNPARTQSLHYVPAAAMILQGENDKVILMRQTNSFSASTNGVGSFSLSEAEQVIGCWRATPTV